jgi:hypothetical protein
VASVVVTLRLRLAEPVPDLTARIAPVVRAALHCQGHLTMHITHEEDAVTEHDPTAIDPAEAEAERPQDHPEAGDPPEDASASDVPDAGDAHDTASEPEPGEPGGEELERGGPGEPGRDDEADEAEAEEDDEDQLSDS